MRYALAICLLASAASSASSQTRLQFEVTSVKPSDPNDPRGMYDTEPNGNRFRAIGATLKMLIGLAFDKELPEISGGPKWLDSDRFNIDARRGNLGARAGNPPQGPEMYRQVKAMLRSLLEDRFNLAVHLETSQEPVYELVLAKGGSKLKETTQEGPWRPSQQMGRGQIMGTATPLSRLTPFLSPLVRRPVIDKTGLTGRYDFSLTYTLDPTQNDSLRPDAPPPVDPDAPSIFTALQEQLGLKLESARGPVEVLVIDRAEKPDAN